MANYPTSAPSFASKSAGQTIGSAHINSLQDETAAIGSALIGTLAHDVKVAAGKYIFDNGRSVAQGIWTDVTYASTNYFANDAASWQVSAATQRGYAWMKIGKTAWIHLDVSGSSLSGTSTTTTQLRFNLPSGLTPARTHQFPLRVVDSSGGTPETGELVLSSGSAVAIVRRANIAAQWTNSAAGTNVNVDVAFETSS